MLRPRGTGRILNRLKKLTGHFVHTEPFNIFAPFSWNCRIVIFPSKASNSRTRKSMFAILCLQSSFFSSCVAKYLGNYTVANKNLAGHGIHNLPFKFSTVPVKNLTSILAFKFSYG